MSYLYHFWHRHLTFMDDDRSFPWSPRKKVLVLVVLEGLAVLAVVDVLAVLAVLVTLVVLVVQLVLVLLVIPWWCWCRCWFC